MKNTTKSDEAGLNRRAFLQRAALAGTGALLPMTGLMTGAKPAAADNIKTMTMTSL